MRVEDLTMTELEMNDLIPEATEYLVGSLYVRKEENPTGEVVWTVQGANGTAYLTEKGEWDYGDPWRAPGVVATFATYQEACMCAQGAQGAQEWGMDDLGAVVFNLDEYGVPGVNEAGEALTPAARVMWLIVELAREHYCASVDAFSEVPTPFTTMVEKALERRLL